jgi:hypothetical protein
VAVIHIPAALSRQVGNDPVGYVVHPVGLFAAAHAQLSFLHRWSELFHPQFVQQVFRFSEFFLMSILFGNPLSDLFLQLPNFLHYPILFRLHALIVALELSNLSPLCLIRLSAALQFVVAFLRGILKNLNF